MQKVSLVRTLYLYLFSAIGLILVVTGLVGLLNMALKAFVFTQADINIYSRPPYAPSAIEKIGVQETDGKQEVCLTELEKENVDQWIASYKIWEEEDSKINQLTVQRQQEAAKDLAMIFIGLPLYLFHWNTIKRELKNRKEEEDKEV